MKNLFTINTKLMFLPFVTSVIVIGFLLFSPKTKLKRITYIFLFLTFFDLLFTNYSFFPATEKENIFPVPPLIETVPNDFERVTGIGLALMPNSSTLFQMMDPRGYDPMIPNRIFQILQKTKGYQRISHYALFNACDDFTLDFLGVGYVFADSERNCPNLNTFPTNVSKTKIYANHDALPRAYIVNNAHFVNSAEQSLNLIFDSDFDLYTEIVLETLPIELNAIEPLESKIISLSTKNSDEIDLLVESQGEAFLVLLDSYSPGWKAFNNGVSTEIFIANHAFRAVKIVDGQNHIKFVYKPIEFTIGLYFTVIFSMLNLVALSLYSMKKRKRVS